MRPWAVDDGRGVEVHTEGGLGQQRLVSIDAKNSQMCLIARAAIQAGVRELPCQMQREESAIWIDRLGPELERLGVPALTCHDSVMVPASCEADVRAVLAGLYQAAGVRAKFA